jgi:hypothetical protein
VAEIRSGPWTIEEDDKLRALARLQMRPDDIAKQLGRSSGAVRMRAARLNVELPKSNKHKASPAWLTLTEDRTGFVLEPARAETVRKIFELSVAGVGGFTIAKHFNSQGIPAFGPSPLWDQSTIHNILTNRATLGEYQPRRYATADQAPNGVRDKKGVAIGEPVKGYYPAVIELDLFQRAQLARRNNLQTGRGRKGRFFTNLFAGIPKCFYCKALVKFHSNGNAKSLICATVLEGSGCYRKAWSYKNFEISFFRLVKEIATEQPAAGREQFAELVSLIEGTFGPDPYQARLALSLCLKRSVSRLDIAAGGQTPILKRPDARIRRDDPARFFEVSFFGGTISRRFSVAQLT